MEAIDNIICLRNIQAQPPGEFPILLLYNIKTYQDCTCHTHAMIHSSTNCHCLLHFILFAPYNRTRTAYLSIFFFYHLGVSANTGLLSGRYFNDFQWWFWKTLDKHGKNFRLPWPWLFRLYQDFSSKRLGPYGTSHHVSNTGTHHHCQFLTVSIIKWY